MSRLIPNEQPPRRKGARPVASLRQGRADWYRIENLDGGPVLHLYDEIGYYGITAADLVAELSQLQAAELTVRLNSPGGDVFDGITIYNCLAGHPARIRVQVDGLAASIASVIAMAGDEVVMSPHSQLMIHDALTLCIGNAAEMRTAADLLDRCSDNIAAVYAERAGGEPAEWRERMRAETWFSAEEAVAAGLADEVATRRRPTDDEPEEPDEPLDLAARWDLSLFAHAGRAHAPAPKTSRPDADADLRPAGTPTPPDPVPVFDAASFRAVMRGAFT